MNDIYGLFSTKPTTTCDQSRQPTKGSAERIAMGFTVSSSLRLCGFLFALRKILTGPATPQLKIMGAMLSYLALQSANLQSFKLANQAMLMSQQLETNQYFDFDNVLRLIRMMLASMNPSSQSDQTQVREYVSQLYRLPAIMWSLAANDTISNIAAPEDQNPTLMIEDANRSANRLGNDDDYDSDGSIESLSSDGHEDDGNLEQEHEISLSGINGPS